MKTARAPKGFMTWLATCGSGRVRTTTVNPRCSVADRGSAIRTFCVRRSGTGRVRGTGTSTSASVVSRINQTSFDSTYRYFNMQALHPQEPVEHLCEQFQFSTLLLLKPRDDTFPSQLAPVGWHFPPRHTCQNAHTRSRNSCFTPHLPVSASHHACPVLPAHNRLPR